MNEPRYSAADHDRFAREVLQDGFCILRQHFSVATLRAWHQAFVPLLTEHIEREGDMRNRGPGRYYVTLPFAEPFADPRIYEDPDVLALVVRLVGEEAVLCQLATDTPLRGSDFQDVHRDARPLFPETGTETPPFQLAVNFPLVDVRLDNGPFEVARGTHMLSKEEGLRRLESGTASLEPVTMQLGDVMIRDVRGLHRGTPNQTGEPRPMVVLGYSRRWLFRPEVSIHVPESAWAGLSDRGRELLRFNPRVANLEQAPSTEVYQAFAY